MKVHLTAKFKVHNPSRRKQEVMDTALEEYTRAYAYLLDWCRENLVTIEAEGKFRDQYTEASIRKLMPRQADLNQFHLHGSIYNSLKVDVAGIILSYLVLRQENPNTAFPTCRDPDPESFPNALEEFAAVLDDEKEYNERRDRLLKLSRGSVMPISFSGADGVPRTRYFSLLWDSEKDRFHAIVYLMPRGAGEPIDARGNLFRMGWSATEKPSDETHTLTAKSKTAIILPLEMGRWHVDKFLNPCLNNQVNVRTAFLSRSERKGQPEYFMHITF